MDTNSSSDPATATPYPLRKPGRPCHLTHELLAKIQESIRQYGLSDSEAGVLAGVPTSTLHRWKEKWEEFRDDLTLARALFWMERMKVVLETRNARGELDWRAQSWAHRVSQVDAEGERVGGRGRKERKKEAEPAAAPKPKYPKDPCDYEWPGGDEEIAQAFANQSPDPDDTRYLPDGGLIITPRVMRALQTARRAEIMAIQERKAAAAGGNVQNIPEASSEL